MAKAKAKKSPKSAASKASAALLPAAKKGGKSYTKNKLIAHLAAHASAKGVPEINKKQAAALVESLAETMKSYAVVGAPLPGLGKLVLREIKARPAREGRNPKTGEVITIPAKAKSQKLVFRFAKDVKEQFKKG